MRNMVLKPSGKLRRRKPASWVDAISGLVFTLTIGLVVMMFIAMLRFSSRNAMVGLFSNVEFRFAVGFTLKTTFLATLGATFTAIPCAYMLARKQFRGKVIVDLLFELPIVLPPLISGVALLILFGPVLGAGSEAVVIDHVL